MEISRTQGQEIRVRLDIKRYLESDPVICGVDTAVGQESIKVIKGV